MGSICLPSSGRRYVAQERGRNRASKSSWKKGTTVTWTQDKVGEGHLFSPHTLMPLSRAPNDFENDHFRYRDLNQKYQLDSKRTMRSFTEEKLNLFTKSSLFLRILSTILTSPRRISMMWRASPV